GRRRSRSVWFSPPSVDAVQPLASEKSGSSPDCPRSGEAARGRWLPTAPGTPDPLKNNPPPPTPPPPRGGGGRVSPLLFLLPPPSARGPLRFVVTPPPPPPAGAGGGGVGRG